MVHKAHVSICLHFPFCQCVQRTWPRMFLRSKQSRCSRHFGQGGPGSLVMVVHRFSHGGPESLVILVQTIKSRWSRHFCHGWSRQFGPGGLGDIGCNCGQCQSKQECFFMKEVFPKESYLWFVLYSKFFYFFLNIFSK